eukprot:268668_1
MSQDLMNKRLKLKDKLQRRIREYRYVVTKGCGNCRCSNPYCKSNLMNKHKHYTGSEASKLALKMVTLKHKHCKHFKQKYVHQYAKDLVFGYHHQQKQLLISDDIIHLCLLYYHLNTIIIEVSKDKSMDKPISRLLPNKIILNIELTDTVKHVKCLITNTLPNEIEICQIVLVLDQNNYQNTLQNGKTLIEYKIANAAKLTYYVSDNIFIKTLMGRRMVVPIGRNETVQSIKRKIEEQEGIPTEVQRLIWRGHRLHDGKLSNYNIQCGDTIHLALDRGPCPLRGF